MGPIAIFDKSFIQSLSLDEAVLFDNFFLTNIVPIFLAETLADLHKTMKNDRSPEEAVQHIAEKTPQIDAQPNAFHSQLCLGDLMGNEVEMKGRIYLAHGVAVKSAEKTGFVVEESPEARAFCDGKTVNSRMPSEKQQRIGEVC